MKAAPRNMGDGKNRLKLITILVIVVALCSLAFCGFFGLRWLSSQTRLLSLGRQSSQTSEQKSAAMVQKAQEKQHDQFQFYLQQPSAPRNDQELSQLIQDKYQTASAQDEDADYVVGHGLKDGELYIDLVTSRTYTLQTAGGLTNENRTFIMCTRLSGQASLTAQVRSIDVPCPAQVVASPTGEQRDAPTLVKLAE